MNTENSQHGSSSNDIACETSPLLSSPLSVEPHRHRGHGGYRSVYLLLIVVAGLDSCMYMINLPLTRVYESIACYHYYSANEPYRYPNPGSIPEILCKVEPVQQELALVRGFEFLCMSLPGVIFAFPFGVAADRYGRKPVFLLSVLGLIIALASVLTVCWFWWIFPLRLVWAAWLLTAIGGGATVLMSTAFSMLSDITHENDRTRVFLQLSVAILAAQACATPLSSLVMDKYGTSVSIAIGYAIALGASILALFVAETLEKPKVLDEAPQSSAHTTTIRRTWISTTSTAVKNSLQFLFESPVVLILLSTFFVNTIGTSSINIATQYASKRFFISISNTGLLISIRAIATIIYFLALLPLMAKFLQAKFGLNGLWRDLWLARLTVLFFPVGFLLMTLSRKLAPMAVGMGLTALGSGCGSLVRSITNGMVHPTQRARLNGAISVVDTLGILISGPLLAEIFALGLRMGGRWMALPFALATVLTAIASAIVWFVRLPEDAGME